MDRFGDAFGIAFAIEGIFFFLEAIFIAIYIYGWNRLSPKAHMWAAVPIVISGVGGAFSVIAANAWMNQPQGFKLDAAGTSRTSSPSRSSSTTRRATSSSTCCWRPTWSRASSSPPIYAVGVLRGRRDRYHRLGFWCPDGGRDRDPDPALRRRHGRSCVADDQPAKFAGMECIYKGGTDQTEYLGGICKDGEVKGGIGIPGLDSLLVGFSTDTNVTGLNQIPDDEQPPAHTMLHLSFDTMVGIGTLLFLLAIWLAIAWWRKRDIPSTPWFLRAVAVCGCPAVVALESGWIVTEVGRQPWILNKIMRTSRRSPRRRASGGCSPSRCCSTSPCLRPRR